MAEAQDHEAALPRTACRPTEAERDRFSDRSEGILPILIRPLGSDPPLSMSSDRMEHADGEEASQAGGDQRQAQEGRFDGLTGPVGGGRSAVHTGIFGFSCEGPKALKDMAHR